MKKNKGMSNGVIRRYCRLVCGPDFKGVFSADCIPPYIAYLRDFIIIVNLGRRRDKNKRGQLPVGHFVTIVGRLKKINYIDPYGLPPLVPEVVDFLRSCGRKISYNLKQIQHLDSVYCGLFSILYAIYMDNKTKIKLKFYKRNLMRNDKLCVKYIEKLLKEMCVTCAKIRK